MKTELSEIMGQVFLVILWLSAPLGILRLRDITQHVPSYCVNRGIPPAGTLKWATVGRSSAQAGKGCNSRYLLS